MGLTRGWRSTLVGAGAATLALAAIVAALGPALTVIPIQTLRLVVGALLLVFGLQWLRKAILRASGWRALRDEDAVFARERAAAETAPRVERAGLDWYAFTISFKGVLLEGLEVAFIVLTFGSTQGSIPLAALGAGAAVVLVVATGLVVREPLSRATALGVFKPQGSGKVAICRSLSWARLKGEEIRPRYFPPKTKAGRSSVCSSGGRSPKKWSRPRCRREVSAFSFCSFFQWLLTY